MVKKKAAANTDFHRLSVMCHLYQSLLAAAIILSRFYIVSRTLSVLALCVNVGVCGVLLYELAARFHVITHQH